MNPNITPKGVKNPFTHFCMSIGAIPTSYRNALDYYETLLWLIKFLENTVIPAVDNNAEALEELQGLFVTLKDYVVHYFDNLDVQDEINNKLDEMAESGELTQIIENYINPYLVEFNGRLNNQDIKLLNQDNKIDALSNGAPLVASSTAGMTDTTKVYVNTTDGKWYYYDGDSWEIGGTYQATENSTTVNNLEKYSAKMVKKITNNNINVNIDSTSIIVSTDTSSNTNAFTENQKRLISSSVLNQTFLLEDYNINSGFWLLVVQSNVLNLLSITSGANQANLSHDDIILAMIIDGEWLTMISDRFLVNDNNNFIDFKENDYGFIKHNNNPLKVINDMENSKFTISTESGKQCTLITDKYYAILNKTNGVEVSYSGLLSETNNLILCVYNQITDTFRTCMIYRPVDIRVTIKNLKYSKKFGDIVLFIYNKTTHAVFPLVQNFYWNGELISDDKYFNKITDIENSINNLSILNYDFLRCFKNFTFIGDSLTAGYTSVDGHTINSATAKSQNNNWPSYLCSRLNRTYTNLGFGSSTIHNWRFGDQAGQETNISLANIDTGIYFVGLGVNDLRQDLTVGSSADINSNDYTLNSDSVYGNYDFIINKLKEYNPHAKIFTFTIPNSETNPGSINNAIKYVSNLYDNVYCIDLNSLYDFDSGFIADNFTNGHYNPITYNYIATLIEKAVNNYIYNNPTEFDLVPYDYD